MIYYIKGKILSKSSNEVIIETSGIGYLLNISLKCYEKLPDVGQVTELFTILFFQQEQINLYGFIDKSEREAFKLLISVPNIGYKTALSILSSLSPEELKNNVVSNNLFLLQKLPGIGKKTAERMVLELKEKMLKFDVSSSDKINFDNNLQIIIQEAQAALISLGYSKNIAEKSINLIIKENSDISLENLIKKALNLVLKL